MLTVFLDVEYWQGACVLLTLQYKRMGRFRNLEDFNRVQIWNIETKFLKKPKTNNHGNKDKMGNRSRTQRNFF